MDENIRRTVGLTVAVLMTLMAAGSFLFRYAGFTRMIDSVESVSLSDSMIGEEEGPPSSDPALTLAGNMVSRIPYRATREGLVRECGGGELLGVLMLAGADGAWDERIVVDGIPCGLVDLAEIRMPDRYRVVFDLDETGIVLSSAYVKLQ